MGDTPASAEAPAPDLVARLRYTAQIREAHRADSDPITAECLEAADTITALRAEVERLKGNMRARLADHINGTPCAEIRWQQERETLEDEIRRLRAALETVRDEYGYTFPTDTNQMIAAALTQEPRT
jgi:predicted phage gp36 major capsid-like protein